MIGKKVGSVLIVALAAAVAPMPSALASSDSHSASFAPRSMAAERSPLIKRHKTLPNVATLESSNLSTRGGDVTPPNQIVSALGLFAINYAVTKAFQAFDIGFPALLGGCIILFCFLLLADAAKSGLGNDIFQWLTPGGNLVAKWLPVFFVPGLAMLPRAPSLGSGVDILKIFVTVIVGFFYTLSTVIYSVLFVSNKSGPEIPTVKDVKRAAKKVVAAGSSAPSKPYSSETLSTLVKASIVTGAISVAATRQGNEFATPLQTIFLFFSTVAAYVFGARLPTEFTRVVHPLVTSTAITLGVVRITAELTGSNFMDLLGQYKVGSMQWNTAGAGDVLLYMLGPAVVSFALSMYSRRQLMKENLATVLTAMVVSGGGGLFGTAAFVRLLQIGGKGGGRVVRLSCLTRNVTTALAIAVTSMLGGDISIAASVVVFTGVFGATFGRTVMDAWGVKDPIARGLALGSGAQGLGVASLSQEPDAFPFAAIGMVLNAVFATVLVSIPAVKEALVNIATG